MWAIKRKFLPLSIFFTITIISLTACGKKASVSSAQKNTDNIEETLFKDVAEDNVITYKTTKVFKGDYTNALQLEASPSISIPTKIICDVEYGTMIFDEFNIGILDFVEAGQPLAKVHINVDKIDIEEKNLKLKRKEERLTVLEAETQATLDEYSQDLYELTTETEKLRGALIYEQMCSDWEYTKSQLLRECSNLQEEILALEVASKITTITSPVDGIVLEITEIASGTSLKEGQLIISIASYNDLLLYVDNSSGQYLTGMPVTVEAVTDNGLITTTGTVISASKKGVTGELKSNLAQIKLDETDLNLYMSDSITVYAQVRTYNNVLLVDSNAVTLEDGTAYVTIVNVDGSLVKKGFKFATSNSSYYFILEGLEEGTTVLTE